MNKAQREEAERERTEAIGKLREMFPPGTYASTLVRHVSRSGMMRSISVIRNGEHGPEDISWLVARATGQRVHRDYGGVVVGGCGMDMGYHLAYSLSRTLYPEGFDCLQYHPALDGTQVDLYAASVSYTHDGRRDSSRHCPSNDHTNGSREWAHHTDGGYALRHRWI